MKNTNIKKALNTLSLLTVTVLVSACSGMEEEIISALNNTDVMVQTHSSQGDTSVSTSVDATAETTATSTDTGTESTTDTDAIDTAESTDSTTAIGVVNSPGGSVR